MKKPTYYKVLKYLVAFLFPLILVLSTNQWLDNDSWYILAEGRYIAENGIYHEDVLSMHEGLNVVVQNYGFAIVFYWIFSIFGGSGIYITMLILNFLICFLLYRICMLLSDKNTNLSLFIMAITDSILALGFVETRAQMISFVLFLTLIYVLELYIKNKKIKYLWWIPLLSFLQINFHASLWLMLFFVLATYIIGSQKYKTRPLILVSLISLLVGLLNPYGIRMITFIFSSYFNPTLKYLVVELKPFSPFASLIESTTYICIMIVSLLYLFANNKDIRIRHVLMSFGFLALGLHTVKGLSQFILVMFFPLAYLYRNIKLKNIFSEKGIQNPVIAYIGMAIVCISAILSPIVISQVKNEPDNFLVEAVNSIDKDIGENEKKSYTVYTTYDSYDAGGYLEYRGYKPYIDSRGEYFIESFNNKKDILKEYADFRYGKITPDKMLNEYNFDYLLIIDEDDPFYKLDNKLYEELYSNENYKTKVYKKVNQKRLSEDRGQNTNKFLRNNKNYRKISYV